ncbi:MAG: entericidin A/B family lipoprotein [Opitutus sp.]
MNRKPLWILLLASALISLVNTGCRTMEGAGKDIERAGEKIQDNAK